jgi:hypothetical protein
VEGVATFSRWVERVPCESPGQICCGRGRLVAWKAEAEARVAEAKAETSRLEVEAELASARFERSLHQLRGGRLQ